MRGVVVTGATTRGAPQRSGRGRRWVVSLAPLSLVVCGVAACGKGTSHHEGVASARGTTTTASASGWGPSGGSGSSLPLEFAQFMRSHAITDFPDPTSGDLCQGGGGVVSK
jgi:hypothetical protein